MLGKRIRLRNCSRKIFDDHRSVWGADASLRTGLIIDDRRKTANGDVETSILLDYALNARPSEKEVAESKRFRLPEDGQNMMIVNYIHIGHELIIENIPGKDCPPEAFVCCLFRNCRKIRSRSECMLTCHDGHFMCKDHFVPFKLRDVAARRVFWELLAGLNDMFREKCQEPVALHMRALLAYPDYVSAENNVKKDQVIEEYCMHDTWACPRCLLRISPSLSLYRTFDALWSDFSCDIDEGLASVLGINTHFTIDTEDSREAMLVEEDKSTKIGSEQCAASDIQGATTQSADVETQSTSDSSESTTQNASRSVPLQTDEEILRMKCRDIHDDVMKTFLSTFNEGLRIKAESFAHNICRFSEKTLYDWVVVDNCATQDLYDHAVKALKAGWRKALRSRDLRIQSPEESSAFSSHPFTLVNGVDNCNISVDRAVDVNSSSLATDECSQIQQSAKSDCIGIHASDENAIVDDACKPGICDVDFAESDESQSQSKSKQLEANVYASPAEIKSKWRNFFRRIHDEQLEISDIAIITVQKRLTDHQLWDMSYEEFFGEVLKFQADSGSHLYQHDSPPASSSAALAAQNRIRLDDHAVIQFDMCLKVVVPEVSFKEENLIFLRAGDGYEKLFTQALGTCSSFAESDTDQLVLFRRSLDGWRTEIVRDMADTIGMKSRIAPHQLLDRDIIEVRKHRISAVGGKFELSTIAETEKFNQSLQSKIATLSGQYSGFRKIRGDGNCYYRSVIFGLIESLIASSNSKGFIFLADTFRKIIVPLGSINYDYHMKLVERFELAADGKVWTSISEFESEIIASNGIIDTALIDGCKRLVAGFIMSYRNKEFNGISLSDAILPSFPDVSNIQAFCKEYVLKMGVCAEGAHVYMGLLPSLLRCTSHIVILPREKHLEVSILNTMLEDLFPGDVMRLPALTDIHLLFRPGHYDLLYLAESEAKVKVDEISTERREELAKIEPKVYPNDEVSQPDCDTNGGNHKREELISGVKCLDHPCVQEADPQELSSLVSDSIDIAAPSLDLSISSAQPPIEFSRNDENRSDSIAKALPQQSIDGILPSIPQPMSRSVSLNREQEQETIIKQLSDTLAISTKVAKQLTSRCSSLEAAMNYYFENLSLFQNESVQERKPDNNGFVMQEVSSSHASSSLLVDHSHGSLSLEEVAVLRRYQNTYPALRGTGNEEMVRTLIGRGYPIDIVVNAVLDGFGLSDFDNILASCVRKARERSNTSQLVSDRVADNGDKIAIVKPATVTSQRSGDDHIVSTATDEPFSKLIPSSVHNRKLSDKSLFQSYCRVFPKLQDEQCERLINELTVMGFSLPSVLEVVRIAASQGAQFLTTEHCLQACIDAEPRSPIATHISGFLDTESASVYRDNKVLPKLTTSTININVQLESLSTKDRALFDGALKKYPKIASENILVAMLESKTMGFPWEDIVASASVFGCWTAGQIASRCMEMDKDRNLIGGSAGRFQHSAIEVHRNRFEVLSPQPDSSVSSAQKPTGIWEHPRTEIRPSYSALYSSSNASTGDIHTSSAASLSSRLQSDPAANKVEEELVKLGFDKTEVQRAMKIFFCANVRSIVRRIQSTKIGRFDLSDSYTVCSVRSPAIDEQLFKLFRTTVEELRYSHEDVANAIAFDMCNDVEDVIDAVEARRKRQQLSQSVAMQEDSATINECYRFLNPLPDPSPYCLRSATPQQRSQPKLTPEQYQQKVQSMSRENVISLLQRLNQYPEKISFQSTKNLRDILHKYLVK